MEYKVLPTAKPHSVQVAARVKKEKQEKEKDQKLVVQKEELLLDTKEAVTKENIE